MTTKWFKNGQMSFVATVMLMLLLLLSGKITFDSLLGSQDIVAHHMPSLAAYSEGYKNYDPRLLGGSVNTLATGTIPLEDLILGLKGDAITAINITVLALLFSFTLVGLALSCRFAEFFFECEFTDNEKQVIALILVLTPSLLFRLNVGHINLILGSVFCCYFFYMLISDFTVTDLLVLFLITFCTFSYITFQPLLYLIFFAPYLLFTAHQNWQRRPDWRLWALFAGTLLLGILLAVLYNWDFYLYNLSGGANRSITGQQSKIYSYITLEAQDLLGFFFSDKAMNFSPREYAFYHEQNYPTFIFCLLPLFSFFPFVLPTFTRTQKKLAGSIFLTAVACILFACNPWQLPQLIVDHIPLLNKFRVPSRIFMTFTFLLSIFSLAVYKKILLSPPLAAELGKFSFFNASTALVFMIAILTFHFGQNTKWYDFFLQLLCLLLFIPALRKKFTFKHFLGHFTLFVCLASLNRLQPMPTRTLVNSGVKELQNFTRDELQLKGGERILFVGGTHSDLNFPWYAGIETLQGYAHPTKAFLHNYAFSRNTWISEELLIFSPYNLNPRINQLFALIYNLKYILNEKYGQVQALKMSELTHADYLQFFATSLTTSEFRPTITNTCFMPQLNYQQQGARGILIKRREATAADACLAVLPLNMIDYLKRLNPQLKFRENEWGLVAFFLEQEAFLRLN